MEWDTYNNSCDSSFILSKIGGLLMLYLSIRAWFVVSKMPNRKYLVVSGIDHPEEFGERYVAQQRFLDARSHRQED